MSFLLKIGKAILLPVFILLVWHLASTLRWIAPQFMPAPLQVIQTAFDFILGNSNTPSAYAFSGSFFKHASVSLYRVFYGFTLASLVGIFFGLILGTRQTLEKYFDPLLQVLRPIPITAWLPLSVIWFGLGEKATVFLIFLGAFFPIFINTTVGVRFVNRRLVEAARMLGTPEHLLFFKVLLPGALPAILSGLRVGLGFAWVCVVVGEMTGVGSGLGSAIADARELLRVDLIIVGMILIGLMGYLSDFLLLKALRKVIPWSTPPERT